MKLFFWKKPFFGLFLWSAVFFPAVAGGPERWMQITSQKALKKQLKKEERAEKLKVLCVLQLKKQQVPYSCYEWLKIASSEGALTEGALNNKTFESKKSALRGTLPVSPIRSAEAFLKYLNEKCQSLAPNLKDLKKITYILQIPALSLFCRQQIEKQKQIREYQLRDENPENLLKWHHPL